jgi:hypothetical protein
MSLDTIVANEQLKWDGMCAGETREINPYQRFSRWNITLHSDKQVYGLGVQRALILKQRVIPGIVIAQRTYTNTFRNEKSVSGPVRRQILHILSEPSWDRVEGKRVCDFHSWNPHPTSFGALLQATSPTRPSWNTIFRHLHFCRWTVGNYSSSHYTKTMVANQVTKSSVDAMNEYEYYSRIVKELNGFFSTSMVEYIDGYDALPD